ncbi:hypothetical protein [Spongiimicrobium salis]|uniref:hypothetical protein n=1 Tax=Spongiimicrobium salis TaxID=1667022 RepID=UPI00374D2E2A
MSDEEKKKIIDDLKDLDLIPERSYAQLERDLNVLQDKREEEVNDHLRGLLLERELLKSSLGIILGK